GVTIESVLTSTDMDFSVHVATPDKFVDEQGPYTLFDPVAEKVGTTPETALLFVSFNVIVIVEAATPLATTGLVPVIVEFAALKALTVTVAAVVPLRDPCPEPEPLQLLLPLLYASSRTVQVPVT